MESPPETPETVAAVDLGSNSFHMVVARVQHGALHVLDRLKERVVLAAGLDDRRRLTPEATDRALACLSRFGERIASMPPDAVRAVGTNTLRKARKIRPFLAAAEEALTHGIEILPGREEARLIYLGVAHTMGAGAGRRLVIDIGGGSTECVLGEGFETIEADSLYMGCVEYSRRFFLGGSIDRDRMRECQLAAGLEIDAIARKYRSLGWSSCLGSSGTITATEAILRENGWSRRGITAKGLRKLRKAIVAAGHVDALELPGLEPDRKPVIAGGVGILSAIFRHLEIEEMEIATGALREGLLHEIIGRFRHEDVRQLTITRFAERYHADDAHAARVEGTALAVLQQVREPWGLTDPRASQVLSWAARLHEIGLSITHAGYHKHGAYIVAHGDMAGFSREDQRLLSALILTHRRKISRDAFAELGRRDAQLARQLCILLRLAVRGHRSRDPQPIPTPALELEGEKLHVRFPDEWLNEHPLSQADLERESSRLRALGLELVVR